MSSDDSTNAPSTGDSASSEITSTGGTPTAAGRREAVREKAQQVQVRQSRARMVRSAAWITGAVVVVAAVAIVVGMTVGGAASKPQLSPDGTDHDGFVVTSISSAGSGTVTSPDDATPSAAAEATPSTTASTAAPVQIHVYVDYLSPSAREWQLANESNLSSWVAEGAATLHGAEYRIAGKPLDFAAWEALEAQLATGMPDALKLVADELRTPTPPRWRVGLTVAAGRVVLDGFLPDAATRERLLARLKPSFPGGIDDRTRLAPGARDGTAAALDFAVAAAAGLTEGAVVIEPAGFSIAGTPRDWATWDGLEKTLKNGVPGGLPLVADHLITPVPSPYRLGIAARDGIATVDGFVPDASTRTRLVAALKGLFGRVEDRLAVAPGAPAGYVETIAAVLPHLARLGDLGFELSGTGVTVKGSAPTAALGAQIVGRLRALLPAGVTLGEVMVVEQPRPPQVDPLECQSILGALQNGGEILFETGRATLDESGVRVLDALVVASLKCETAHVTVEGHTDASGDPASNQMLSEARAAAVVGYLVAAGISRGRLSAVGWGETRPVADNDTAEGRKQNRRIEFKVD